MTRKRKSLDFQRVLPSWFVDFQAEMKKALLKKKRKERLNKKKK
jgi:hypothetical protein